MAITSSSLDIMDEIASFVATSPTHEQWLNYRLPEPILSRASELLEKNRLGTVTDEENTELDRFVEAELFLQSILARIHALRARRP